MKVTSSILASNIDSILFIHSTVMLLLAGVFYSPWKGIVVPRPELFLMLFAFFMGMCQWIDLAAYMFPSLKNLVFAGMVLFALSFLSLLLYSMHPLPGILKRVSVIYVFAALVLAIYTSADSGILWGYSSLYNTLAFPASFATAYCFIRKTEGAKGNERKGWIIAAIFMAVYSFCWLLSAPYYINGAADSSGVFSGVSQDVILSVKVIAATAILSGIYITRIDPGREKRYKQEIIFFPCLMLLIMIVSLSVAEWRGRIAGNMIKNEILREARGVANAIDPERIARLKFTPEDVNNPSFILKRNQMIAYGYYSGLRSIYSFTMVNGKLVFGPENININDPMSSPPGTVYLEPHPDFIKIFNTARPGVIGPYRDEYGSFVTGYAPVIDPGSGKVLLVVGIDVLSERWREAVTSARFKVFIIASLSVLAVISIVILIVIRRDRWKNSNSFALRQLETIYIAGAGVLISFMIFFMFDEYEDRKVESDFTIISDSMAGIIRENIRNLNYDIKSLAKYFESSESIEKNEFMSYTSEMRVNPVVTREWYPGSGKDTESFKLHYRAVLNNYRNERVINITSTRDGISAIKNSITTGTPTFVMYNKNNENSHRGSYITVVHPVIKKGPAAEGVVALTADIGLLLEYSMSFSESTMIELNAEIVDITDPTMEEPVAFFPDKGRVILNSGDWLQKSYPVFIFGRVLVMKIISSETFIRSRTGNMGMMGGVSALMVTIAVTLLSANLRRREYSLEELVTERTRDLRESEERFRTLHEASFGGIAIHDGGVIVECNEGLARMSGYSVEELTGMNGLLLIDEEWRDFVWDKIRTGYEETYDAAGIRKDGSVYHMEITGKNIPYHGKDVRVTEFRDITERKRNEELLRIQREELEAKNEELHAEMEEFESINAELIDVNQHLVESEEKFFKAFNINPAIMSLSTIEDARIYEVNEAFLRSFGYERDEVIGKTAYDLNLYVSFKQRDLIIDFIKRDGFVRNFEIEARAKSGVVRIGLFSADFISINDRKYMLSVITDITERKEMEQALRENETKYRMLFESAVDGILLMENNIFIDCNSRALDLFGCMKNEIIGETPYRFSPETQPDGSRSFDRALEKISSAYSGAAQNFEWTHSRLDGTIFDAEVSLNSFILGNRRYIIAIVRDVTEKKRIEARLSHMQKMDAIGQLAGGVAHDFNNQLSGILGYAEILSLKLSDSALKKYSDGIISVAIRSADLTKKLLAFARKGQFQLVPVDMHSLVDETIEILMHSIDRRINIVKRYNAVSATVSGDPAQLQNALLNLGLNSRDAMPEGGTLTFETEDIRFEKDLPKIQLMDVPEGRYLSIRVTDTGKGMDDAVKSHLFEPFFTTKESGKGTGMGLASVYGTVKNHNGTISVYSEEGHGTSVMVYLPLLDEREDPVSKVGKEEFPDIPQQKILVVDDEDTVRSVLSEILTGMGHVVYEAPNGNEGVSIYSERWREIDVVVIDMIMPELNGRDAFLEMKKINPEIKAILSSGFSMDIESQMMLSEGVKGFIHKPYRKSELIKTISAILSESR